jgi:hypothetical protein
MRRIVAGSFCTLFSRMRIGLPRHGNRHFHATAMDSGRKRIISYIAAAGEEAQT